MTIASASGASDVPRDVFLIIVKCRVRRSNCTVPSAASFAFRVRAQPPTSYHRDVIHGSRSPFLGICLCLLFACATEPDKLDPHNPGDHCLEACPEGMACTGIT